MVGADSPLTRLASAVGQGSDLTDDPTVLAVLAADGRTGRIPNAAAQRIGMSRRRQP